MFDLTPIGSVSARYLLDASAWIEKKQSTVSRAYASRSDRCRRETNSKPWKARVTRTVRLGSTRASSNRSCRVRGRKPIDRGQTNVVSNVTRAVLTRSWLSFQVQLVSAQRTELEKRSLELREERARAMAALEEAEERAAALERLGHEAEHRAKLAERER